MIPRDQHHLIHPTHQFPLIFPRMNLRYPLALLYTKKNACQKSLKYTLWIFISVTQIIHFGSSHPKLVNGFWISTSITFSTHLTLAFEWLYPNALLYILDADIEKLHLTVLNIYIHKAVFGHRYLGKLCVITSTTRKMEMLTSNNNKNSIAPNNNASTTTTATNDVYHNHLYWKRTPPMQELLCNFFFQIQVTRAIRDF